MDPATTEIYTLSLHDALPISGKRSGEDGDSGLSGRVYAMLAKEMSDTRNRGRIVWVFATSRPDLLEVDLKRRSEEHTSELQSRRDLVCRLLLEKKKKTRKKT